MQDSPSAGPVGKMEGLADSRQNVPVYVLDGGLGTTLQDQFHAEVDGSSRPLWSSHLLISDPPTLRATHTAFAKAGAKVISTATYQASFEGFSNTASPATGLTGISKEDAQTYMRHAVDLAEESFRNCAPGQVALSLGAYGAIMIPSQEYTGKYDEQHRTVSQLRDWHAERLHTFANDERVWHKISMVAFETVPLVFEIKGVRQAMFEAGRDKDFWISCVFPGDGDHLPDGSTIEDLVQAALLPAAGSGTPFAVGINCTRIGKISPLIQAFQAAVRQLEETGKIQERPALVLYPDGTRGEVYNTSTHEWEKKSEDACSRPWHDQLAHTVSDAAESNIWKRILVGGCCKTNPDDIKSLRDTLHRTPHIDLV